MVAHLGLWIVRQLAGFNGTILQRTPSLFIAAFGIFGSLEQLPQHAVRGALTIQRVGRRDDEFRYGRSCSGGQDGSSSRHSAGGWADTQVDSTCAANSGTMMLTLRLLGDAAASEILLSSQVGHRLQRLIWLSVSARGSA
jgi:hypothetical protein